MEEVVKEIKNLAYSDVSNFSIKEQTKHYKDLESSLNKLMNTKNIDIDIYEDLLKTKSFVMSKLRFLQNI